jgi:hypothetical protein
VLGRYNLGRTVQSRTGTSLVLVPPRVLLSARVLQVVPSRAQPTRQGTRPRSHVDMAGTAGWPGVQPNRPSRSRSQAVRQALGRLYTVVGASPRCRHIPTGTHRYRHGADRLLPGPTLGRAVLVCPAVPRLAYVGPHLAVPGFSEVIIVVQGLTGQDHFISGQLKRVRLKTCCQSLVSFQPDCSPDSGCQLTRL